MAPLSVPTTVLPRRMETTLVIRHPAGILTSLSSARYTAPVAHSMVLEIPRSPPHCAPTLWPTAAALTPTPLRARRLLTPPPTFQLHGMTYTATTCPAGISSPARPPPPVGHPAPFGPPRTTSGQKGLETPLAGKPRQTPVRLLLSLQAMAPPQAPPPAARAGDASSRARLTRRTVKKEPRNPHPRPSKNSNNPWQAKTPKDSAPFNSTPPPSPLRLRR